MSTVNIKIGVIKPACNFIIRVKERDIEKLKQNTVKAKEDFYGAEIKRRMNKRWLPAKTREQAIKQIDRWVRKKKSERFRFFDVPFLREKEINNQLIKKLRQAIINKAQAFLNACNLTFNDYLTLSIEDSELINNWIDQDKNTPNEIANAPRN